MAHSRSCHVGAGSLGWELVGARGGAFAPLRRGGPGIAGILQRVKVEATQPSYGLGPELGSIAFVLINYNSGHYGLSSAPPPAPSYIKL